MFSDLYRHFTCRMPWSMLLAVVKVIVSMHRLDEKLPKRLRKLIDFLIPISGQPNYEARILDAYDWYSPKYQFKSSTQEVLSWFNKAALQDLKVLDTKVAIRARTK
jgi:hypothetical protein